jgi:hypothetical protein
VWAAKPSREELLALLDQAQNAIVESQQHWGAVVGLTGDRRFQRQQRQALELLDAMRDRVELYELRRE